MVTPHLAKKNMQLHLLTHHIFIYLFIYKFYVGAVKSCVISTTLFHLRAHFFAVFSSIFNNSHRFPGQFSKSPQKHAERGGIQTQNWPIFKNGPKHKKHTENIISAKNPPATPPVATIFAAKTQKSHQKTSPIHKKSLIFRIRRQVQHTKNTKNIIKNNLSRRPPSPNFYFILHTHTIIKFY